MNLMLVNSFVKMKIINLLILICVPYFHTSWRVANPIVLSILVIKFLQRPTQGSIGKLWFTNAIAIDFHESKSYALIYCYTLFRSHLTFRMKGNEKEKEFCLSQENLDSCNRGLLKWSMVTRKHEIIVAGKTRFEVKR